MPGSSNNLIFYAPGANNCITLLATDGSLTVHKNARFDGTVSIGGSPVATKPQYAARFTYGGGNFIFFKSWGANTLTTSNVIRDGAGRYKFSVSVPLQDFSMILVTSHGGSLTYASARIESNTVWWIYTSYFSTSDDLDVGFMTVP
jgi:hypothetical protein